MQDGQSPQLNFIKYYKKYKNMENSHLILETKPKPRWDRLRKVSRKNWFNKEEMKTQKIF